MQLYQPTITGSLSVSGSINLSGSITLAGGGTISGTASIATTASYAVNASNAVAAATASFVALAQSASNAITASSADDFLVRNTLTAQTLVVQTITSSVDFVTGSTRFGSIIGNTHQFTGSVSISGSGIFSGSLTSNGTLTAGLANGNIRLKGSTDGFLGVGESNGTLYLTDWATGAKGLSIILSTGAAAFSNTISATNATFTENSGNVILQALKTGATNATTAIIRQTGAGGNGSQDIGLIVDIQGANDQDRIANFRYYDGSSYNSRMVIQRGGNVGIGTTDPSTPLHVNGAITGTRLYTGNLGISMSGYGSLTQTVSGQMTILGHNVISDASTGNKVNVLNGGWYSSMIKMYYNEGITFHSSNTVYSAGGTFYQAGGTSNELMRITNGGNVGINTTAPSTKLDVRGAIAMGNADTYPKNVRFVKQGSTSITFTALTGTIGAWRPGHAFIKVSGGRNGLQEYWAAWFFIRIIAYFGSSAIMAVIDSGGDTGSVSFSSSSDTNSPQTMTFTLTDGGGTTDTMIADIDLTYHEGIVSIS